MLRIALCQINTTVGDLDGNLERLRRAAEEAASEGADLAVFPELTLTGYPPEDLLLRPRFLDRCAEIIEEKTPALPLPCLLGAPLRDPALGNLYNTAVLIQEGVIVARYRKVLLPNYSVFDEERYFTPGDRGLVLDVRGRKVGVIICEDAWDLAGPARDEAAAGADTILNLSASPFHKGKGALREETFAKLCRSCDVNFVYCNLVGGQDELVFDGGSMVMSREGDVLVRGPEFAEAVFYVDLPEPHTPRPEAHDDLPREVETVVINLPEPDERPPVPETSWKKLSPLAEIYDCLCLGVRDYVRKNGFEKVVIGLSGGIDSALTAAVAVDALGADNVTGVTLPSRYSSEATRGDAAELANNLAIAFLTIPIGSAFAVFEEELAPHFAGCEADLTEENLQARIRAVYLMALSNKFGWLVLNTSNKSEAAVGYGTMYGDMIGAYGVLKDVFKTTVFELSWFVNERHGCAVIPETTITRPPSAELRDDQKDSDALPEYDVLDPVLEAYIEQDLSTAGMIERGFDPEVVRAAVRMTDAAEWKRRQSVPAVRVTPKAFGKDRRPPLTNRYRD